MVVLHHVKRYGVYKNYKRHSQRMHHAGGCRKCVLLRANHGVRKCDVDPDKKPKGKILYRATGIEKENVFSVD
jgi:hypothetical protein